uniref:Uncharacterized protein n=1 Tax=Chlamydomonas euryale TaxID=1486919 RepID=A0A7R9V3N9_9CHLO
MVNRGSRAMQGMLSTVLFSICPQLIDVLVSSTYLAQALEPTIAVIMFCTVASYMPITVIVTEWRGRLRREVNKTEQALGAKITDAFINYEAVKLFSNMDYESGRYDGAIGDYLRADWHATMAYNALNAIQSMVMFAGTASGLLVCLGAVSRGEMSVGDTVLYLALMAQLYQPLAFFGMNYRVIQQYMIDMENLLNLLEKQPKVSDAPDAQELLVSEGKVEYDNVTFGYTPGNPVIKNVSISIPGGHTIAFVGATGSGKSTLTRLLFRFYDVDSGAVRVDGVDVRSVTQASLRRAIAVVPQDTVLFHDTIMNNIRYGNVAASDEEVIAAAKSACIHEAITTRFPGGYDTVVGERGLRLSGGEKQRVAFARAILKNPKILVLDEATSALDSITEKAIQDALDMLRVDRTTLIVAHRLSTVASAHAVVAMALGEVKQTGTHQELLVGGGLYADLWARQQAGFFEVDASANGSRQGSKHGSGANLQALAPPSSK